MDSGGFFCDYKNNYYAYNNKNCSAYIMNNLCWFSQELMSV